MHCDAAAAHKYALTGNWTLIKLGSIVTVAVAILQTQPMSISTYAADTDTLLCRLQLQ